MNRAQRRAESRKKPPPKPPRFVARKTKLHGQTVMMISIQAHFAAERLRIGQDVTGHECQMLAAIANITELLCRDGLGSEQLCIAMDAQAALQSIDTRALSIGKVVSTGPELVAINAMLELHDAQIESPDCTEAMYVAAIKAATRHMSS